MSAQHIEADIEFALQVGVDYIILDGRGGATGAAPLIFRDNISVPTIPALARARRCLDRHGRSDITLIVTGGLRTPADFIKALCLGADGIAVANAAIQAIGCVAARICNTNNCPTGIATQKEELRARLNIEEAAARLCRFLSASVELMKVMARACGHKHFIRIQPKRHHYLETGNGRTDRHPVRRDRLVNSRIQPISIPPNPTEKGESHVYRRQPSSRLRR